MNGQIQHGRMKMYKEWEHRFCAEAQENGDGCTDVTATGETEAEVFDECPFDYSEPQRQEPPATDGVNESKVKLSEEWRALVVLDFIFGVAGLFFGMIGRIVFFFFSFLTIIYFMSVVMYNLVKIANAVSSKNNK